MNKRNIAIGSIAAILGLAAIGNALPDEAPASTREAPKEHPDDPDIGQAAR